MEFMFLFVLALVWIAIASYTDLKKREVPNWISFSLPIFALAYRAFYSILNWEINFFLCGLIGYLIFIVLGYLFYYGRIFAGGDAKLLMGLGAILPFGSSWLFNFETGFTFFFLFFVVGAVYGVFWSVGLMIWRFEEFKKEFNQQLKKNKKLFWFSVLGIILTFLILIFELDLLLVLGIVVMIFPMLYVYAKSIEESAMIKELSSKDLVEGDWLYKDVKLGGKIIRSNWEGVDEEEIKLLKKSKKNVLVKQGIPFVPVFLISFILFVWLWNSSWSLWEIIYHFA